MKLSMMKLPKDPRINVSSISVKEYGILFFVLAAINGTHMMIYQKLLVKNMMETNVQFVINVLMGFVMLATIIVMFTIILARYISWNRPMRLLGEAARKITQGDFSVRIAPMRKDGKKDFMEIMFDDFNTMAEELESIETLKTDFIANVSHEIKTPLSVIQGYAAALKTENLSDEKRSEYIETIYEASNNLGLLVTNILKLNKLENQKIIPSTKAYNLSEQIRRCILAFEPLLEQKNITVKTDLEDIDINYDEQILEIVWNNLISNAVKFSRENGNIYIDLRKQNDSILVTVTDTGIGIDEKTKKRIFEKFYQGDTSHSQEGNGLGLALVKQIIGMLDAEISVESAKNHGATFTVLLKNR